MAASGSFISYVESVDYPGPPWGRAAQKIWVTLNWHMSDDNFWTCDYGGVTGSLSWYPCSSFPKGPGYRLDCWVQFSPNGNTGWRTVWSMGLNIPQCGTSEAANFKSWQYMRDEITAFPGYQLEESGFMRVLFFTTKPPYPSSSFRYAYPDANYSEQSAASHIPVSYSDLSQVYNEGYRPGERKISGVWQSHQRGGRQYPTRAERKSGGWYELKTKKGDENAQGTPPERKRSNAWYNMRAIGNGKDDK